MSVDASFDLSIIKNDIYHFSAKDLLSEMMCKNWNVVHKGKICYLPLHDTLFEWTEKDISESALMEIVTQKEQKHEIIGLVLYWQNTDVGVSMLIFPDDKITFGLMINRVKLDVGLNMDITDINWYMERIICCFEKFQIDEISFQQTG